MEDDGLAADLWTFKNLVQGHCKASHWVGVQEILSAMQARGLQPDTGMFNTIMLQQCRDNSPEGAKQAQVRRNEGDVVHGSGQVYCGFQISDFRWLPTGPLRA